MNRVRIVAIAAAGIGVAVVAGSQFQSQEEPVAEAISDAGQVQQTVETALVPESGTAPSQEPAAEPTQLAAAGASPTVQPAANAPAPASGAYLGRPRTADELFIALTGEVPPHVTNGQSIPGNDVLLDSLDGAQAPIPSPAQAQTGGPRLTNASVVPEIPMSGQVSEPAIAGPDQAQMLRDLTSDPTDPGPGFEPVQTGPGGETVAAPLDETLQAELDNCAVWVVATPAPGAMLDFSVYAPCDRGGDVTVTHAGLTVDTRIGPDGQLAMMVPALAENATLTLGFTDGRLQSDSTYVPDLAQHERVVLQWEGPATMLLHAYEFGAEYGQAGHVHAGQPRAPGQDGHGFLSVLGDPAIVDGRRAQVYSYPRGEAPRTGSVRLEIEAPVTDASCGKPLDATAIEMLGGVVGELRAISLEMPACDGEGGYVVLPGALPDLRIAMN